MPEVLVPAARWSRWLANFEASHGAASLSSTDHGLRGTAADGSWFSAHLPFSRPYEGPADADAFASSASLIPTTPTTLPGRSAWGVLLVRKGGFAVARLEGPQIAESKVGQRHVQGRTKAGGQSQQRFARRRANQARVAYEAAAEHAVRILQDVEHVVAGGDRSAVAGVLDDARLRSLTVVGPWLAVPDPRRAVLEGAVREAQALVVYVENRQDRIETPSRQ
ncbi:MAG: hypothetical protein L0H31_10810 [Nocardioidaceae bacterium]|nr:hypothetical protein [Nocardioidaceae bacterium]